jgi:glycosyltransferase involved in cell wall biosynthesis
MLLLGRRDQPTDGVADYCEKLREAGTQRGLSFESVQVHWAEMGWRAALAELREAATAWRDRWVLLQFTTLAWSRRGFPLRASRALDVLRQCGARPGVVFHDFAPLAGKGIVGSVREYCQLRALWQLYERSDLSIFTVPVKQIFWLPMRHDNAVFIPVGANCPEMSSPMHSEAQQIKTVAVYSVTGGTQTLPEVADIGFVLKRVAQVGRLIRLTLFGRGSREAESAIRAELRGVNIEIDVLGLISPEEVTETLARADVLLFVRGQISSRRGSAIAGIACGLPIVCYLGPETDWPVTEAGIQGVPLGDRHALAGALENVLSDARLRNALSDRSRNAQEKYFSWAAITATFAKAIGEVATVDEGNITKNPSGEVRVV